jgi:hypothetical protein
MARALNILLFGALVVLFAGCASNGSFPNPFSACDNSAPSGGHFFSEFEDIPIPNEMREISGDSVITFAPTGVKCGMQRFQGRVEMVSLMNTMRRSMANHGWTLRSLLRAQRSILIFEKHDRMAFIEIIDGMLETEMRIVVSARLEGDSSSLDVRAYSTSGEQRLNR